MIIGIDISRANRPHKTGVEWYVYFLIEELKKLEIGNGDVQVRLYSDTPVTGELSSLPEHWEIKVLRWPPRRFWTQIRLSIEMLLHKPDILCIPAHVPPLIHPKRTVMTIHDIAAIRYAESYNRFERWYSVASAKKAMRSLWKIITPSAFTKQELEDAFGSARHEDITVVPHGYDSAFRPVSQEEKAAVMREYGIHGPYLLSVGRMEAKKNTARMVDAFHILKSSEDAAFADLQLVLVGKPGHGYEYVAAAIEESPYKEDIIIPGWVEQAHLPALMNGASVFLFPSLYEGFGIPILEAFACHTPVVTTVGHSAQEVGGRAAVYVDPESTEDIARATRRFLLDPEFRKTHVQEGIRRVSLFSWERAARETLAVLLSS